MCPTSKLKRLLATETSDEDALGVRIAESYQTYAQSNLVETITTRDLPLADKDAAERSKDDDNTNTVRNNNPDILINDGTYVCMLEDNHLPTFGVLVHDVTEDNHYGTCIMADGNLDRVTFKTFAYNTLYKAMERNKEQTYRLLCPTSKLKRLLACETCDEEALRVRIAESY